MSLHLFSPFSIISLLSPQLPPSIPPPARVFSSFVFPFLPSHILLSSAARSHPYKSFNPELSLEIEFFSLTKWRKPSTGPIIPLVSNANQFASGLLLHSGATLESGTTAVIRHLSPTMTRLFVFGEEEAAAASAISRPPSRKPQNTAETDSFTRTVNNGSNFNR